MTIYITLTIFLETNSFSLKGKISLRDRVKNNQGTWVSKQVWVSIAS